MGWDPAFGNTIDGSKGYSETPSSLQQLIDYGAATDGQPLYVGFAPQGASQAADDWLIQYFTYVTLAGNRAVASRTSATGAWSNRASLNYA